MASSRVNTPDGISWHVEQFSPKDSNGTNSASRYAVLIPSGEGDAGASIPLAHQLASLNYHVITFDNPGFSRTSTPDPAYSNKSPEIWAKQVIALLDALNIKQPALFFGCSSGGVAALGICVQYPDRVRAGIVHEMPLAFSSRLNFLYEKPDEEISAFCREVFATSLIEKREPWDALGSDFHQRLEKNYVTWLRHVRPTVTESAQAMLNSLKGFQCPVFWTVGGLNEGAQEGKGNFQSNFEWGEKFGVPVNGKRLRSLHFPGLTVPEETARWIQECDRSVGK